MKDEILTIEKPKIKSTPHNVRNEDLSVRIHTDETVFSTLEDEWTDLASLSNQMLCMSWWWAASWWKHFGEHNMRSLFIVTVYDHERLVAIFPFYRGITSLGGFTIQQRIQLIGSGGSPNEELGFSDDYGISDFLDLIVDPEYETSVAELFVNLLGTPDFTDHQITFHQTRDDSYIMQTLYPELKKMKREVREELTDTCYYIELDRKKDFKNFIRQAKSNARRRFRQTLRARGAENEYAVEEPADMEDVEQMTNKLMQLHQARWNKIGYPGAFKDERFIEFFKEITFDAFQEKRLWLKQAVGETGVCAVRMLLMYNGRFYDYMSGYDDDSPTAKYRPGIGLLLELVENSFELPVERIELLRGDESYKHDFTHLAMNNWEITIPEIRHRKTGWGVPVALLNLCSTILKYANREKMLLNVQYEKVGLIHMIPEYLKFRFYSLKIKINQLPKT